MDVVSVVKIEIQMVQRLGDWMVEYLADEMAAQ